MVSDKNSEIVHAGVLFDRHYMVEALDKGAFANDLRIQNKALAYRVYRPRQPMLGATAANVVKFLFDHHQNNGTLPYTYVGPVTSLGAAKPMCASSTACEHSVAFDNVGYLSPNER